MSFEARTAGWALHSAQNNQQQYAHQHVKADQAKFDDLVNKQTNQSDATQGESFSFGDIFDIINPLQHIPIVSSIYRDLTGDEINGPAKIAGGGLYGGPLGAMASTASVISGDGVGKVSNETVLAASEATPSEPDVVLSKEFEDVLAKLGQNEEVTFDRVSLTETPEQVKTKMQDALIKYQAMKQEEFEAYRRMPLL